MLLKQVNTQIIDTVPEVFGRMTWDASEGKQGLLSNVHQDPMLGVLKGAFVWGTSLSLAQTLCWVYVVRGDWPRLSVLSIIKATKELGPLKDSA
jgi:hypothetical protein